MTTPTMTRKICVFFFTGLDRSCLTNLDRSRFVRFWKRMQPLWWHFLFTCVNCNLCSTSAMSLLYECINTVIAGMILRVGILLDFNNKYWEMLSVPASVVSWEIPRNFHPAKFPPGEIYSNLYGNFDISCFSEKSLKMLHFWKIIQGRWKCLKTDKGLESTWI